MMSPGETALFKNRNRLIDKKLCLSYFFEDVSKINCLSTHLLIVPGNKLLSKEVNNGACLVSNMQCIYESVTFIFIKLR